MKACFGHTEGAAGIHGAMLPILAVQHQAAPAVMHLRGLNAYVSNAVADWRTTCNLSASAPKVSRRPIRVICPSCTTGQSNLTCKLLLRPVLLLQEGTPLPLISSRQAAGASSFGMSGVNAHGLFTPPKALTHETREVDWQRERHWMVPAPHHLLGKAQYSRQAGQCR